MDGGESIRRVYGEHRTEALPKRRVPRHTPSHAWSGTGLPVRVAVPREVVPGEQRVALVPDTVERLVKAGFEVLVEADAGVGALFSDEDYRTAGATVGADAAALFGGADVVVKVQKPVERVGTGQHEAELMADGAMLIGFLQPLLNPDLVARLTRKRITSFSMDAVPRIARAQAMDALSSQSSIGGYKAALIAASSLGKLFPMMMTAAGTIPPAKVLVMGTGVAGLQAIATARRLGAVVQGYDIRPVAREQVESLGATFVSPQVVESTETAGGYAKQISDEAQQREREQVLAVVAASDVVIITALIPGRRAPILVTKAMVEAMRPGSVIVDLAAEMGGNCELTEPGASIVVNGVTIHGPTNLPATVPTHASQLYSRNLHNLLQHLTRDGQLTLDFEDTITRECCITHAGEVVHAATRALVQPAPPTGAG